MFIPFPCLLTVKSVRLATGRTQNGGLVDNRSENQIILRELSGWDGRRRGRRFSAEITKLSRAAKKPLEEEEEQEAEGR